jgi:hypothetical protein
MSDALPLFIFFSAAAAASGLCPHVARLLSSAFSKRPRAEELELLLAELSRSRDLIASLRETAVALVSMPRALGGKSGPLSHADLSAALERRLRELEAEPSAAGPARVPRAQLEALLAQAGREPRVLAALEAARCAHPLYAAPARLLELQEAILREQAALFASAVAEAHAAGMPVNSEAFDRLVTGKFAQALGALGRAGAAAQHNLAPLVLARAGEEFQGRAPLWAHLLGAAVAADSAGEQEFQGFQSKLTALFRNYEGQWWSQRARRPAP